MANKKIINIGNQSNDGTGDTIRDAFDKVNSNFDDLYNVAGLGDGLRFVKLREAPATLSSSTILGINTSATKIVQRTLVASTGVQITLTDDSIIIANTASNLKSDANPVLGGDLDGLFSHKGIKFSEPTNDYDTVTKKWVYDNFLNRDAKYEKDDTVPPAYFGNPTPTAEGSTLRANPIALTTATKAGHLVNKEYADRKISLKGAYSVDPATNAINPAMGTMTGPLVLFRDPITQDDVDFGGKIAATKAYVDSSSFVSSVNFFVATTGRDNRTDIPSFKKGRALAYAFKTIGQAGKAAEEMLAISEVVLGPYQKIITTNNGLSDVTVSNILETSPYVTGAKRISVGWSGGEGKGTDAYANGSLFPGCFILGESSGAVGQVEKIGYTTGPNYENYDIVPVDYAKTIVSNLTPMQAQGNVILQFNTPNLVNVPEFWKGYIFKVDNSVGGGEGQIVDVGYYTDPVTQNVYDRITVNFTTPLGNMNNVINGVNWHVYSGYFQLGERLRWGQRQDKTQITIVVESGEHLENYPVRLSRNVSVRGDEFRRSIPKPGTFINSDLPTISVSPWASIYFRRDTQTDGILVAQRDTRTDYVTIEAGILTATPDGTENNRDTGVVTFTVSQTINGITQSGYLLPASWKGKVFVGCGGQGEILSVTANTFAVNLAQNSSFERKLTTSAAAVGNQWHVYSPVNHGYQYLRDAKRPINYVIKNQLGNYLTSARLLTLNKGYIQAEISAYITAKIAEGTGIWAGFSLTSLRKQKWLRDVETIVDAICVDLDAGNISNSLTVADFVTNALSVGEKDVIVNVIGKIGELAQRIVQNIPTGEGQEINSYSTKLQTFDRTTYQSDMAVIRPTIGYALDPNNIDIIDEGLGYQFPPTISFVGGGYSTIAKATASINTSGAITGLIFTDVGAGYTLAPIVVITRNGDAPSVEAEIEVPLAPTGTIKSVEIVQPGRGYYSTPGVKVVGNPGASGGLITITTGTVGPYSIVTSANLVNGGSGYSQAYIQLDKGSGTGVDNSLTSLKDLTDGISSIVDGNPDFNPPLYNNEMDCFLMNDANVIRYISCQGHGGFMKVLDPEGQILAKSPYTQTASSFSRSKNRQVFSGGMLVDGFVGNLQMTPRVNSQSALEAEPDAETGTLTKIFVQGLKRRPQTPTFFLHKGITFEVSFVSEFQLDDTGVTYQATLNLNPARPGGFSSGIINATGFQGSKILPVSLSSPTVAGGVKAVGTIQTDGAGALVGTSITFTNPGVGYVNTASTVVIGGAIISFPIDESGSVATGSVQIINSGTGYTSGMTVNFGASGGTGGVKANATVIAASGVGGITGFTWINTGSGYTTSPDYWFGTGWNQRLTITNGYIGTLPSTIETVTAGNRSMLANDFTQVNDLGYGVFATNGGLIENVSMFTYYCYTSYYALNGAILRTITGSSAYGNYGLVSEGSDPLETPIALKTLSDTNQIVNFKNATGYTNVAGASIVYGVVSNFDPYGKSEVEVNHYGVRKIYTIVSATKIPAGTGIPSNYYLFSLDTNGEKWLQTMIDGEVLNGTYRIKYQQKFSGLNPSVLTRTATVINYSEDPQTTYNISGYSYQGNDITLASSNNGYNYISIQPWVESTYRQGIYSVTKTGGTGYTSGQEVTLTFNTITPVTANAQYAYASTTESTSSVIITNATGPLHVGMLANSADSNIINNRVTWVNTSTSSPTRIGLTTAIKNITSGTAITFTGTRAVAKGTANSSGVIDSITVTESGIGYSADNSAAGGPLPATASSGNLGVTAAKIAGLVNTTVIKITELKAANSARILAGLTASTPYYYMFGYEGFLFKITGYRSPTTTGQPWAEIDIQRISQSGADITPSGLSSEMMSNNLYAGIMRNQDAAITVKVSTLRATSHDMVDIGTGGYASSKYPNDLYGPPLKKPGGPAAEVIELRKGRVFFVTTDQDGTFSVGGYLIVDQAKGQVSLNAPVALANLPSIKLQKGQLIDDFSADSALTGESNSTIPTERAIVQFVERRLGTSRAGAGTTLNLIGPGYLDLTGVQGMKNRLNMNSNLIQALSNPGNSDFDATNKGYVDNRLHLDGTNAVWAADASVSFPGGSHPEWGKMRGPLWASAHPVAGDPALQVPTKRYVDKETRQLSTLSDVVFTAPQDIDLVGFSSTMYSESTATNKPIWYNTRQVVNLANDVTLPVNTPGNIGGGSDVAFTRTANTLTIKLTGASASGVYGGALDASNPITDYHVNSAAQIRQYKLLMTEAKTTATNLSTIASQQGRQAHLGVSVYDSTMFSVTNGYVTLADSTLPTNGIVLSKLQQIPANGIGTGNSGGILGSVLATAANVSILTSGTVVTFLQALTKDGRQTLTGNLTPEFDATVAGGVTLGSVSRTFKNVYADTFTGTATKAIALLSNITPHTYVEARVATSNGSIVQRSATGNITGVYLVDDSGSIAPATNELSDVGTTTKRFNNIYTKTISAGSSFSGNLFGSWTLTGVSGSRPELLGPDNGVPGTGANIGRDNAVGRINTVYTRTLVAEGANIVGMTITNVLNGSSAVFSGNVTAGSLTLNTTALEIGQGGTGGRDVGTALQNLLPTGVNPGTVLTFGGSGNYYWGAGGGGGGDSVGTEITTSRNYFTAGTANGTGYNGDLYSFTLPLGAIYTAGQGQLRVYINGVRQFGNEITETGGGSSSPLTAATFRIISGTTTGDSIMAEIDAYYSYPTTAASITYSPVGSMNATYNTVQKALDYIENDKIRKVGGTLTAAASNGIGLTMGAGTTLQLAAGTITVPTMKIPSGALLTTPQAGAVEFDGSLLYATITSGNTRKTVAFQDWVGAQGFITLTSLSVGSNAAASGSGGIGYANATGVFTYTPPDLSGYQTKAGSVYLGSTAVPLDRVSGALTLADVTVASATTAGTAGALTTTNDYQLGSLGVGKTAPGSNSIAVKGGITAEGDITAYYTSDSRLKTKIESITGALDKVSKLDGITFNWNEQADGKDQTRREAGIIAQQIQEVLPEAVAERENGMLAVRYEQIVPLLIEAIKELKAEVDFLKKAGK
jgi:hypothetical protein